MRVLCPYCKQPTGRWSNVVAVIFFIAFWVAFGIIKVLDL